MAKNQSHTGRVSDCNCSVRWHFGFRRILKDEEAEDLTTLLQAEFSLHANKGHKKTAVGEVRKIFSQLLS